jgi:hypothetical protein
MSTAALMPETLPERKRIRRGWCYFLLENLDEFARLAWYLVADVALVECVMVRLVARLEGTPFGGAPTYDRARDTLINEAIAVLNLPEQGYDEIDGPPVGPVGLCELPDLRRLAFLLNLVPLMPTSRVSRLLNEPASAVSALITRAIFQRGHSLPGSNGMATADA